MKIFGYDKTTNESELLEMREVTFRANPDTLRAIAEFLNKSAELIEGHRENFGHLHLQDEWSGWKEGCPDVIVSL